MLLFLKKEPIDIGSEIDCLETRCREFQKITDGEKWLMIHRNGPCDYLGSHSRQFILHGNH